MAAQDPTLDFFLTFSETTDQVIFHFDITSNQLTFLSSAFEPIWRQTRESVINNPSVLLESIHPEDRAYVEQLYKVLRRGIIIEAVEFRIQLHKNTERWICLYPRLINQKQIIGSAQDITVQKEYNEVLKKFSDKKNSVLNILSHDLAGPLASIQSLSAMLGKDLTDFPDPEHLQEVVQVIERTSKQGMQLIQDFIKQEFLESANVDLIKRRVNLVSKINACMEEYWISPLSYQKTFQFLPSADTIFVNIDDNKFMQVINNLVSNAIKFTPDGGKITVALEEKQETVLITIVDTGIGIPEKYHASLFEKFTRARRPGIKGEPSVGLGMSIIKTIVEWHKGKIWFDSEENKGTTFYIEVPKI